MMYRPKFCCNCGEKIERIEWRLWTSRRFCELCATEFKHIDLVPIAAVAFGVLLSIFGINAFFRNTNGPNGVVKVERPANPEKQLKPAPLYSVSGSNAKANTETNAASVAANTGSPASQENSEQPARKVSTSEVAVFYCGAITKKGTPCTRRVKTKGFCWQHAKSGQVAPTRF